MLFFGVIHNYYINIVVYDVFFFYLSKLICDSPFAPNKASLYGSTYQFLIDYNRYEIKVINYNR